MKPVLMATAAMLVLAACAPAQNAKAPAPAAAAAPVVTAPAGQYHTDPMHSSLNFRVNHMGMSHYTARFLKFNATLDFDPKNISAMKVSATIDPASLQTNYPEPEKLNFDKQIAGPEFFDAGKFPTMTFVSTKVVQTGPDTADITGDLTMHGVTKPVVLHAKYNGGYDKMAMDPGGSRIGFSATGTLKRSDFGMGFGVPAPGTTMGVFDEVEIIIETEMLRPLDK
ncbi:polyisoprenoid-binding protein YceI [Caulobacter ginsengisoli]|uniref:Polyisoprenoid-binding protein YceI n=1 Tax=Caulobacter ginsengisoli TaxID=400775 RepID=A0ABU0IKL3_9CAUL|nr:YceI family protein [Caulobacter ginsengisoli]MDQ0462532.1 polyisoprenoid-binding protein YceI [Caulobacter ginsengisoli]